VAQFAVILPAAGRSTRFHNKHYKKPFAPLAGKAVWLHAAERFLARSDVKQVMLVVSPEDRQDFEDRFAANVAVLGVQVVEGGSERADSVQNALARVRPEIEYVCIHDAARPCLADSWIDQVFQAAERTGAAILAVPVTGTLKRVGSKHTIEETVSREKLWEAQTPQVAKREWLLDAYAKRAGFVATDDAQLLERAGRPVSVVQGSLINLKITTADDLRLAEQALHALPKPKLDRPWHPFSAEEDMWH